MIIIIKKFEDIKHIDKERIAYWYVRELQSVLNYKEWRNFENVINKAKESCKNSDISVFDHFVDVDKMVQIGLGAERKQKDYKLTRYAYYLIAQNGDTRKKLEIMSNVLKVLMVVLNFIFILVDNNLKAGNTVDSDKYVYQQPSSLQEL